jgi:hypothetical protein
MPRCRVSSLLTMMLALACAAVAISAAVSAPGGRPTRLEVWDLKLGTPLDRLPDEFIDYACGTNGGPPSVPLAGWREVGRCRPEPGGLREVYFRYDDEWEYWAKANNLATQMEQYSGTKTYGFPITVSALIDEQSTLRGIRLISDPRGDAQNRDEAYLLRNFLTARFGRDGGRRHLRQGALPQANRCRYERIAGDAPPAQGRPEPLRSAYRARDHGAVREHGAVRIGAQVGWAKARSCAPCPRVTTGPRSVVGLGRLGSRHRPRRGHGAGFMRVVRSMPFAAPLPTLRSDSHFPTNVAMTKSTTAAISRLLSGVECGSGGRLLPSSAAVRP